MAVDDIFIVKAPFTPRQVVNLWHFQSSDEVHPFTCRQRGDHPELNGDKGVLIPTTRGWICQFCDYTQDWAHDLMVDFDQRPKVQTPQPSPLSEEIGGEALKWTYKLKNAGNGFMVSDEKHGNLCDVFMTNDPKIAEGRANLISAAPELLAALRDAHKAACWGECEINLVDGQYVGHHEPACISRAALLKRFEGVGEVKP